MIEILKLFLENGANRVKERQIDANGNGWDDVISTNFVAI